MYYKYLADEHGRSKNGNLKYLDELKRMAKEHRNNPTKAERIFWSEILQYDKIKYRFLRQKPINKFILDFYCSKLLLAIEIDGDSHNNKKYLDSERDIFLAKYNIKTIRYTNEQVFNKLNIIKDNLIKLIEEREKLVFCSPFVKGESGPATAGPKEI